MVSNTYIPAETNNFRMLHIDADLRSGKMIEQTKEECTDNHIVKPAQMVAQRVNSTRIYSSTSDWVTFKTQRLFKSIRIGFQGKIKQT